MAKKETMSERLLREMEEAAKAREDMKDQPPIERLLEATTRSIQANSDDVVGRDGRQRLSIRKISAEGDMAQALRELKRID